MTSSRTGSRTEPYKKRFRVYSITEACNPLLVDSFDLREQARQCIDRMNDAYGNVVRMHGARRPRLVLIDAQEETMELMRSFNPYAPAGCEKLKSQSDTRES